MGMSSDEKYCLAQQICASSRDAQSQSDSGQLPGLPNPEIPPVQARELITLYHTLRTFNLPLPKDGLLTNGRDRLCQSAAATSHIFDEKFSVVTAPPPF